MRYRYPRLPAMVLGAAFATLASAQGKAPSPPADNGFFRPSADPSLTAPRPSEPTRPTEALTAEDKVQAADETVARDRPPDPQKVMRWSEQQMDRSEQEARKARPDPRAPAPINGAFTGQTDPRTR
jgi:hypothetical protein